MNTMDFVLVMIGITTGIFVVVQTWLYLLTGSYMETMTTMWFTYILGECGVMGTIKAVKVIIAQMKLKQEEKNAAIKDELEKLKMMAEQEAGK